MAATYPAPRPYAGGVPRPPVASARPPADLSGLIAGRPGRPNPSMAPPAHRERMTTETTAVQRESLTLVEHGLFPIRIHANLTPPALLEHALRRGEGTLTDHGAFAAVTAPHTGRSPKDKFVVEEPGAGDRIWWEKNPRLDPAAFERLLEDVRAYLDAPGAVRPGPVRRRRPGATGCRCASSRPTPGTRSSCATCSSAPLPAELAQFRPGFTVLHAPDFQADPARHGTRTGTFIVLNFAKKLVADRRHPVRRRDEEVDLHGAQLPAAASRACLPMHCSANVGTGGRHRGLLRPLRHRQDHALRRPDPPAHRRRRARLERPRRLQLRGRLLRQGDPAPAARPSPRSTRPPGCSAPCWRTSCSTRRTRAVDFDADRITENTRACYPIHFIPNHLPAGAGGHPRNIVFLTADAFGVLPPIARLTPEQAMYHFLSGYTAKVAGTERGVTEPTATFSACFGAPFLPLPPGRLRRDAGRADRQARRAGLAGQHRLDRRAVRHRLADEARPTPAPWCGAALSGRARRGARSRRIRSSGSRCRPRCPACRPSVLTPRSTWADAGRLRRPGRASSPTMFRENFEHVPVVRSPRTVAQGRTRGREPSRP